MFEGVEGGPGSLIKYNPLSNMTSAEVWNFLRVMVSPGAGDGGGGGKRGSTSGKQVGLGVAGEGQVGRGSAEVWNFLRVMVSMRLGRGGWGQGGELGRKGGVAEEEKGCGGVRRACTHVKSKFWAWRGLWRGAAPSKCTAPPSYRFSLVCEGRNQAAARHRLTAHQYQLPLTMARALPCPAAAFNS